MTMIRALLSGVILAGVLSPAPRPVRIRTTMRYYQFDEPRRTQAMNALNRGLYQDSLIAPVSPSDTALGIARPRIVVIRATFDGQDQRVRVCLVPLNVLAQPIIAPDTATVKYSELDSVLTSVGARYARLFAQDRLPASTFGPRCT
jgi:hypothetical protein